MRVLVEEKLLALFAPEELRMPPRALALLFSLVIPGLMFARAYEGKAVDDAAIFAIFDGLVAEATD
jgi:hypothetical protein